MLVLYLTSTTAEAARNGDDETGRLIGFFDQVSHYGRVKKWSSGRYDNSTRTDLDIEERIGGEVGILTPGDINNISTNSSATGITFQDQKNILKDNLYKACDLMIDPLLFWARHGYKIPGFEKVKQVSKLYLAGSTIVEFNARNIAVSLSAISNTCYKDPIITNSTFKILCNHLNNFKNILGFVDISF